MLADLEAGWCLPVATCLTDAVPTATQSMQVECWPRKQPLLHRIRIPSRLTDRPCWSCFGKQGVLAVDPKYEGKEHNIPSAPRFPVPSSWLPSRTSTIPQQEAEPWYTESHQKPQNPGSLSDGQDTATTPLSWRPVPLLVPK